MKIENLGYTILTCQDGKKIKKGATFERDIDDDLSFALTAFLKALNNPMNDTVILVMNQTSGIGIEVSSVHEPEED